MKRIQQYSLVPIGVLLMIPIFFIGCRKNNSIVNIQLSESIQSKLEKAADSVFKVVETPGMIAIIAAEGEPDFIIKRGVSNVVTGESMNENSYWRIASNTKTFTGAAVLILADEGKINLDSSISHYLPDYNIPKGNKISIRMLGNMTSGLYNYTDDTTLWKRLHDKAFTTTYPPDSMLAIAFKKPNNFEPGTSYEYCNTNTVLLGLLMEKVTGKAAKTVIEEKVLTPLKLSNTYWGGPYFLKPPYIQGYNNESGPLVNVSNYNPSWGYTAGAMISNFSDMKIWAKAAAEGALLSDKMKKERFTWVNNFYGFCMMKAFDWLGHSGSIYGYNSHVLYNGKKKMTLIILCNNDNDSPVESFSAAFRTILN